jgi:predicted CoA-binding protein
LFHTLGQWCEGYGKCQLSMLPYYIIDNLTFVHGVIIISLQTSHEYCAHCRVLQDSGAHQILCSHVYTMDILSLDALQQPEQIKALLTTARTIAVVGLSPKENRPSNMVARYLLAVGYTVIPVNPGKEEILGYPCFPSLTAIGQAIDIVDIFRRSEDVLKVVEEAIRLKPLPKAVWMQQGIINEEAAQLAREHGVQVIMDRCIKVDHEQFLLR